MKSKRIQKKHIGRPMDFKAADGATVLNGRIETVRNGIATVRYYVPGTQNPAEGFTGYLPVASKQIVEIY
jgi:hypothetical protein